MAFRRLRERTKTSFVPLQEDQAFHLPPDHQPGMEVPPGGSMCANCKFLKDPQRRICGEPNFIAWKGPNKPAGSPVIPLPINRYCSDWYQARRRQ